MPLIFKLPPTKKKKKRRDTIRAPIASRGEGFSLTAKMIRVLQKIAPGPESLGTNIGPIPIGYVSSLGRTIPFLAGRLGKQVKVAKPIIWGKSPKDLGRIADIGDEIKPTGQQILGFFDPETKQIGMLVGKAARKVATQKGERITRTGLHELGHVWVDRTKMEISRGGRGAAKKRQVLEDYFKAGRDPGPGLEPSPREDKVVENIAKQIDRYHRRQKAAKEAVEIRKLKKRFATALQRAARSRTRGK